MERIYEDRADAGRRLGSELRRRPADDTPIVLGLPRGGVPVAAEIADALGAPLDVLVVRKVGVPGQPELAMGAVATGGVSVRNEDVLALLPRAAALFERVAARERVELARREATYRGGRPPLQLAGRTAILVDDGVATGSTVRAAITAARALGAARVVVAVPVASREALAQLEAEADDVVCLQAPERFLAVGLWYEQFPQLTDAEVTALLDARSGD